MTAVEGGGCAARAGIRRGARLLEVCRAAVVALHHDQLVDLLKTSDPVTVSLSLEAITSQCKASLMLNKTKMLAKERSYAFVWVKGCRIFLRKNPTSPVQNIKTEQDLKKIFH